MSIRVTWEADDGYAGGSRPHTFTISEQDIEDCMSDDDLRQLLDEEVQAQFDNHCRPIVRNFDSALEQMKAVRDALSTPQEQE